MVIKLQTLRRAIPSNFRDSAQITAMTSPQVSMPETAGRTSYGFGVLTAPGISLAPQGQVNYYALTMIAHDGALAGYSANPSCLPQVDFCFVTLASADNAFFNQSLVTAIQTLVTLPAPTTPPDVAPRLDRLDAYVGSYVDPFALGTVQITRTGDSLSAFVPTLDPVNPIPLTATSTDNFVDLPDAVRPPSLAAAVAAFTATAGPYCDAEEAARARWAGTEDTPGTTAAPTVSSGTHDADGTTAARAAGTTAAPTVSSGTHGTPGTAAARRTARTAAALTISSGPHGAPRGAAGTAAARTAAAGGSARTRRDCAEDPRGTVGHDQKGPNGAQPHDQETLAGTSTGIHDRVLPPKSLHLISGEQRRPSKLDMT